MPITAWEQTAGISSPLTGYFIFKSGQTVHGINLTKVAQTFTIGASGYYVPIFFEVVNFATSTEYSFGSSTGGTLRWRLVETDINGLPDETKIVLDWVSVTNGYVSPVTSSCWASGSKGSSFIPLIGYDLCLIQGKKYALIIECTASGSSPARVYYSNGAVPGWQGLTWINNASWDSGLAAAQAQNFVCRLMYHTGYGKAITINSISGIDCSINSASPGTAYGTIPVVLKNATYDKRTGIRIPTVFDYSNMLDARLFLFENGNNSIVDYGAKYPTVNNIANSTTWNNRGLESDGGSWPATYTASKWTTGKARFYWELDIPKLDQLSGKGIWLFDTTTSGVTVRFYDNTDLVASWQMHIVLSLPEPNTFISRKIIID